MGRVKTRPGFTSIELLAIIIALISVGLMANVVARRALFRSQLAEAARVLAADIEHVRLQAIEQVGGSKLIRESDRRYRAAELERELPDRVRFDGPSADSVVFNAWGARVDGSLDRLVLIAPYGLRRNVIVHPSGAVELAER